MKYLAIPLVLYVTALAHGSSIRGTVTFEGEPPAMPVIDMDVDPICASKHTEPVRAEVLVLGDGQTMANVIVQITEGRPESTPVPPDPVIVTQEGCQYSPHVFVVRVGQPLKVLNPDGTLHNIHGLAKVNAEFNKTMTKTTTELTLSFDKPEEPFALKCQVHPWMTAYCAVVDHSFYVVTTEDGTFEFPDLPPGTYTLEAWHERLGVQTAEVTVTEEAVTQDFSYSRKSR